MSAGLLVDVVNKDFLGTARFVGDGLLGSLGEELDGWVRLDALLLAESLGVWCLTVDLGNQNIRLAGEGCGERFKSWGKCLAVSAPL